MFKTFDLGENDIKHKKIIQFFSSVAAAVQGKKKGFGLDCNRGTKTAMKRYPPAAMKRLMMMVMMMVMVPMMIKLKWKTHHCNGLITSG